MPVRGQQKRPCIARCECNEAIVLQSCQSDCFVLGKYRWEEPPGVIPATAPGWRVERQQLLDKGLDPAAIGMRNPSQELTGNDGGAEPGKDLRHAIRSPMKGRLKARRCGYWYQRRRSSIDDGFRVPAVARRIRCDLIRSSSSASRVLISSDWVFALRSFMSRRSNDSGIRTVTAFALGCMRFMSDNHPDMSYIARGR